MSKQSNVIRGRTIRKGEADLFSEDSGFSPYRLTLARYRRRVSMKELAAALRITGAAVTRFENGTLSPANEHIATMASILSFPEGFFYGDSMDGLEPESLSFRARRAMPAAVRDRTIASGVIAAQTLSPLFQHRFTMPKINFHDLSEYGGNPQGAARHLRSFWNLGLGPIKNMVRLLEAAGIEIYWIKETSTSVDAVSFWHDDRPFILLNSTITSGDRVRFNLAHELAHIVLHRRESSLDGRDVEAAADQFASAFLLPGEQFYHECPEPLVLSNFFPLKRRWGVSIQAMIRRARDLGAIKEWQYERAFKQIGMAGWRAQEPVTIPCEDSTLHSRVYSSLRRKAQGPEDMAKRVHLDLERDLLEMTPVARHYLSEETQATYEAELARAAATKERPITVEVRNPSRPKSPLPPRPASMQPELERMQEALSRFP